MIEKILEAVFALVLVGVVPALSYQTSKRVDLLALSRRELYISAAISQWLLAALGLAVTVATSLHFATLGFRRVSWTSFFMWVGVLAGTSLISLCLVVTLENKSWWPPERPLVYALIPRSGREKMLAVSLIAPTAAICEEFLYRGFLFAVLSEWFRSAWWGLAASSLAFGMAHFYQGLSGMSRAALLGAFLAAPVVRLGSLYPSIAAHFLIDAVALIWIGPKMLPKKN